MTYRSSKKQCPAGKHSNGWVLFVWFCLVPEFVVIGSSSQSGGNWRDIAMRTVLAIFGGYAFAYAATAAVARLLPLDRIDALTAASLPSFMVYLAFILWAFSAASVRRVLVGASLAIPLAGVGFWSQLLEVVR